MIKTPSTDPKFKFWTEVWFEVFHYSSDERIIEIITEIKFAIKNLLIHSWEERLTCFDRKVCFGSKFTSSAEGRRFNWLIYDSMTSLFACGRFSKSRGLSASVSSLPSPFPSPSFTHSIHRPVILCSRTAQKRLLRRLMVRTCFHISNRPWIRCDAYTKYILIIGLGTENILIS